MGQTKERHHEQLAQWAEHNAMLLAEQVRLYGYPDVDAQDKPLRGIALAALENALDASGSDEPEFTFMQ